MGYVMHILIRWKQKEAFFEMTRYVIVNRKRKICILEKG